MDKITYKVGPDGTLIREERDNDNQLPNQQYKVRLDGILIREERGNDNQLPIQHFDNENLDLFRMGFTAAIASLYLLWALISYSDGFHFINIFFYEVCSLPILIYTYLDSNSLKESPLILYANKYYLVDLLSMGTIALFGVYYDLNDILLAVGGGVTYLIISKLDTLKLMMAFNFIFVCTIILTQQIFDSSYVFFEIAVLATLLFSYMLSGKIRFLAYDNSHYTFITVFEKGFYRLKYSILLLLIFLFLIFLSNL